MQAVDTLSSRPGTYAIVLRCRDKGKIFIGQLGEFELKTGHYIYIGSAFGPGGVRARVMRHHRAQKCRHWHVDYIKERMTLVETWHSHDIARREHQWASAMSRMNLAPYIKGFGSSDCKCFSHLFHASARPQASVFRDAVTREIAGHARIDVWTPP